MIPLREELVMIPSRFIYISVGLGCFLDLFVDLVFLSPKDSGRGKQTDFIWGGASVSTPFIRELCNTVPGSSKEVSGIMKSRGVARCDIPYGC